ncbi:hypothetical protein [Maridesulfovibrio sp.]|uniref:hypothetical protein n=1 Tax=Maridesulfovibrio sp. TaxID=2795000 RepID=UPI003BA93005
MSDSYNLDSEEIAIFNKLESLQKEAFELCMSLRKKATNKFSDINTIEERSAALAMLPNAGVLLSVIDGYKWRYIAANMILEQSAQPAPPTTPNSNPAPVLKLVDHVGHSFINKTNNGASNE